jgi:hypothetical protein
MFVAIDVAIGLVFVYLLLSILCTAMNEWIAGLFRLRAKTLKTAISRLVDEPPATSAREVTQGERLSSAILAHPLITSIQDGKRGPSYIPASRFVAAFKDTLKQHGVSLRGAGEASKPATEPPATNVTAGRPIANDLAHVQRQMEALRPMRTTVAAVPGDPGAATDDNALDQQLRDWFNQGMERATGWYKRRLMLITIVLAAIVTVVSNADTLVAARILWRDPSVRAAVVAQAQERAKKPRPAGGGIIDADYPDKDKPVSDSATVTGKEESAEREGETDDETASSDGGITPEEQAAVGQLIGWDREFKEVNTKTCAVRQKAINEACKVGQEASEACRKAIDDGTADGACVQSATGLVPTDASVGFAALFPLLWMHLVGWFITAVAVSLGAPFWFDTLKLFMSVRSSGQNPDEAKKK